MAGLMTGPPPPLGFISLGSEGPGASSTGPNGMASARFYQQVTPNPTPYYQIPTDTTFYENPEDLEILQRCFFEDTAPQAGLPDPAPPPPQSAEDMMDFPFNRVLLSSMDAGSNFDFSSGDGEEAVTSCPTISEASWSSSNTGTTTATTVKKGTNKRQRGETRNRSVEQMEKIRERNRILARKTRQRKKVIFEGLQSQVNDLTQELNDMRRENSLLKEALGASQHSNLHHSPPVATPTIMPTSTCTSKPAILKEEPQADVWKQVSSQSITGTTDQDLAVRRMLKRAQHTYCLVDCHKKGHPIVSVSRGFLALTGYKAEQVVGQSLKVLQGPRTDAVQASRFFTCLERGVEATACLLVYKSDGSTYWSLMHVGCLLAREGEEQRPQPEYGHALGVVLQCPVDGPDMETNGYFTLH